MSDNTITATASPEQATPSEQIKSDEITLGTPPEEERTEAFAGRLFEAYIACMEVLAIQLGDDLGLYRALAAADWSNPAGLAAAAGIDERYAREWLEQQAVAGILEVDRPEADAAARRYHLPQAHRPVLLDPTSPAYLAAGASLVSSIAQVLPRLVEAYRDGGGVSYADYGSKLAHGVAAMNGAAYQAELGSTWLPSVPAIDAALRRPGARVLDLGCGHGITSMEIARAYPQASVVGVDLDQDSVRVARAAAATAGLADRVTFVHADAAAPHQPAGFDAVTIFEALHDMGDPVGALRAARAALRDGGQVLVADERVAEAFTAPGDELERFCYGASVLHCLPATMAESPVEASGTVLRPATVARWSREAGFRRLEQLPIDSVFWRFYLLVP